MGFEQNRELSENATLKDQFGHPPTESEGWTVVIMERASRFLWMRQCGQRDQELFAQAIHNIC